METWKTDEKTGEKTDEKMAEHGRAICKDLWRFVMQGKGKVEWRTYDLPR
jgi:hypothetical protein